MVPVIIVQLIMLLILVIFSKGSLLNIVDKSFVTIICIYPFYLVNMLSYIFLFYLLYAAKKFTKQFHRGLKIK